MRLVSSCTEQAWEAFTHEVDGIGAEVGASIRIEPVRGSKQTDGRHELVMLYDGHGETIDADIKLLVRPAESVAANVAKARSDYLRRSHRVFGRRLQVTKMLGQS